MKTVKILIYILICVSFFACKKESLKKKTQVTFQVNDELGKISGCNYRIVKANGCKCSFSPEDIMTHIVDGKESYTFDDVEPGTYAGLIGAVSDTYEEFVIEKGDHVTLKYTYTSAGSISGNFSSGSGYSANIPNWYCTVSKD